MKYVITKKCYANEFVMVEAENEQEAFDKANNGEGTSMGSYLEFGGYQPVERWEVEEVEELTPETETAKRIPLTSCHDIMELLNEEEE